MKVDVHSYLPNAHLNLWSNFNFNKFFKSETSSCGFAKIGITCGEKSSKRRESLSVRLSIKRASKSMIKFKFEKLVRSETLSFIFARVGLEGVKLARTVAKVGVQVFIWNGLPNLWSNLTLRIWSKVKIRDSISLSFGLKEGKMALRNWKQIKHFRTWFHQVSLRSKIAWNPLKVCMHGYLSNGYLNSLSNFN